MGFTHLRSSAAAAGGLPHLHPALLWTVTVSQTLLTGVIGTPITVTADDYAGSNDEKMSSCERTISNHLLTSKESIFNRFFSGHYTWQWAEQSS